MPFKIKKKKIKIISGAELSPPSSVLLKSLLKTLMWGKSRTCKYLGCIRGFSWHCCSGFFHISQAKAGSFSCLQVPVPKAAAVPLSPSYLVSASSSIISFPCTPTNHKYFDRAEIGSNYTFSFAGTSEGMRTSWPDTAAQCA